VSVINVAGQGERPFPDPDPQVRPFCLAIVTSCWETSLHTILQIFELVTREHLIGQNPMRVQNDAIITRLHDDSELTVNSCSLLVQISRFTNYS